MQPLIDHGHGIYCIDSGYERPHFAAIHLIVENGRAALIDAGVHGSVSRVLDHLDRLGIPRDRVDFLFLTHVHLDHAGGAGAMMEALPRATLVVHPRGGRHMADPSKLTLATYEVYGEAESRRMYGDLIPVPHERIVNVDHEARFDLAGRELLVLDTPGHAKHHIAIRDGLTGHFFTGDTFGISYREFDARGRQFVFPTTSPSQFDPEALHRTVDLIAGYRPEAIYVTHYSKAMGVETLAADMHRLIDRHVAIALAERTPGPDRHARLLAAVQALAIEEAATQGWARQGQAVLDFLKVDLELNAQGLGIWLDSRPQ